MELFRLLKWTLQACGQHFRTLYSAGIFLTKSQARLCIESGWKMLEVRPCWHYGVLGNIGISMVQGLCKFNTRAAVFPGIGSVL